MRKRFFATACGLLSLAALAACQPAAKPEAPAPAAAEPAKPTVETIAGTLIEIVDAGYPMAFIKIRTAPEAAPREFLTDQESVVLEPAQSLEDFMNKRIEVVAETAMVNDLLDVVVEGESVLGGERPVPPNALSVTGTLSGAEEVTASDLPSLVQVRSADGEELAFELFVPPELVPANGKAVTARYLIAPQTRVTAIKLAPG